jgi:hypothetical protein
MKFNIKSKKFLGFLAAIISILIVVVFVISPMLAPKTSTVVVAPDDVLESEAAAESTAEDEEDCLRFPTFSGQSLSGEEVTFPDVFSTEYVLIVSVFSREQQMDIVPWLATLEELTQTHPNFSFYDIPMIANVPAPIRLASLAIMRALVDEELQDDVVVVFVETQEVFLEALEIPNVDNIRVFIVNTKGEVLWCTDGDVTEETIAALEEQMALLTG